MNRYTLNTLPEEVVNQIAAGEVVERPASVVKELVDNSIDAKATKIQIKIVNGGIDLIEVSDNGIGIPQDSLEEIFKPHTTSKISSLEDLNTLLTMGFRGEALSTILSVSEVSLLSKFVDSPVAYEILFKSYNDFSIKKAARESGTIITVRNLFGSIPARRKFLKTPQTEYKKILDVLYPYFLIYPNIHFTVLKESKVVIDLPIINSNEIGIAKERVRSILKEDYVDRMIKVFFNGNGIKISGLVAHPSDHQKRSSNQFIFVNRRPIWESGIARGVLHGYERYIPFGEKVPFLLLIDINPDQVDVNVHPRKEEIRFLNPYRAYSSVTEAVSRAISSVTSYRAPAIGKVFSSGSQQVEGNVYTSKDITFGSNRSSSVRDSLLFSKEALNDTEYVQKQEESDMFSDNKKMAFRNIFQIFNKYIVIEFENNTLWIIDQHAAAERITFEKLKDFSKEKVDIQNLLVPTILNYSKNQIEMFNQLKDFFNEIGFDYEIDEEKLIINSVPVEFIDADFKIFFDEILAYGDEDKNILEEVKKLREDILATISCHTSVRTGQMLHREEMIDLYNKLIACENPYSCPHGRPVVWKMKLSDIDSNFDRTY